jgi:hypothetical protein
MVSRQFNSNQHEEEISKYIEQALHGNKKSRCLPDFLSDQDAQMCGREKDDHDQHCSQHPDRDPLNFCE